MSLYKSHEVVHSATTSGLACANSRRLSSPTNKPLQSCYAEGINKTSDTDTPEIQTTSTTIPHYFTRRRSSLGLDDRQRKDLDIEVSREKRVSIDSSSTALEESEGEQMIKTEVSPKQNEKAA